jgi:hypothetical protein
MNERTTAIDIDLNDMVAAAPLIIVWSRAATGPLSSFC